MKKLTPDARLIVLLASAALIWRAVFFPLSRGAYTDGILQVDAFRQGLTFWPPLYGLLARVFVWLPGIGLEGSGRIVSWMAGAAIVPLILAMSMRLFGRRAAIWAAVVWLVSPMALRWSVQLMTDMTATALWTAALGALLLAYEEALPELFPAPRAATPDPTRVFNWLLIGSLLATLTTLTRYQGILLLPPMVLATVHLDHVMRHRSLKAKARRLSLTLLCWLAIPLWLLRQGMEPLQNHFDQIGARGSQSDVPSTLIGVYWLQFEEFLRAIPLFLTFGIAGFLAYGLLRTRWQTARLRWFGWLCLYMLIAVLAAQSIFSSFQSRYLLPLLPLACIFAGHGFATFDRHSENRRLFWAISGTAIAWSFVFAVLVGIWQGSPFYDLKKAARYINDLEHLSPSARVFSYEVFNDEIQGAKLRFWLKDRPVNLVLPTHDPSTGQLVLRSDTEIPPKSGDLLVLSSAYLGGPRPYRALLDEMVQSGKVRAQRKFMHRLVPLLPDIMSEPGTHQNPLALVLRYRSQYFETAVMEVLQPAPEEPHGNAEPLLPLSPVATPGPGAESLQQLEDLQQEISDIRQSLADDGPTTPAARLP